MMKMSMSKTPSRNTVRFPINEVFSQSNTKKGDGLRPEENQSSGRQDNVRDQREQAEGVSINEWPLKESH